MSMKHNSDTIWHLTSNAIWFWQKTKSFIQVMIDVLRQASKACVVKREFSKVSFRASWKLTSLDDDHDHNEEWWRVGWSWGGGAENNIDHHLVTRRKFSWNRRSVWRRWSTGQTMQSIHFDCHDNCNTNMAQHEFKIQFFKWCWEWLVWWSEWTKVCRLPHRLWVLPPQRRLHHRQHDGRSTTLKQHQSPSSSSQISPPLLES